MNVVQRYDVESCEGVREVMSKQVEVVRLSKESELETFEKEVIQGEGSIGLWEKMATASIRQADAKEMRGESVQFYDHGMTKFIAMRGMKAWEGVVVVWTSTGSQLLSGVGVFEWF